MARPRQAVPTSRWAAPGRSAPGGAARVTRLQRSSRSCRACPRSPRRARAARAARTKVPRLFRSWRSVVWPDRPGGRRRRLYSQQSASSGTYAAEITSRIPKIAPVAAFFAYRRLSSGRAALWKAGAIFRSISAVRGQFFLDHAPYRVLELGRDRFFRHRGSAGRAPPVRFANSAAR